jgi:hypothetical protein
VKRTSLALFSATLVLLACNRGGKDASSLEPPPSSTTPAPPSPSTPPIPGDFTLVGELNVARCFHTATLLTSGTAAGKVLVACGQTLGPGGFLPCANLELFDPAKGTFADAGSLASPRFSHTATRLSDGRVLMVGGFGPTGVLASAECYDPASGTVSTMAGALAVPRAFHTAVLLTQGPQAGKVLVAGGQDGAGNALGSMELFDPATGRFTLLPAAMATGRVGHTATLLEDGRVLFAGGQSSGAVETYQPATGEFTVVGTLVEPRSWHTATLLAGKRLLLAGGVSGSGLAGAELCDLSGPAPRFTRVGPMLTLRRNHMAALLANGCVLLAGGAANPAADTDITGKAELFDPSSGTFLPVGNLKEPVRDATLTPLPDGSALVAGGMEWIIEVSPTASVYR